MSDNANAIFGRLGELARDTVAAQASLAKQALDLGRATAAGEIDASRAGRAYVTSLARESTGYWLRLGTLGVGLAHDVVELGSSAGMRVLKETSAAGRREHGPRPSSKRPRPDDPSSPAPDSEQPPEQPPEQPFEQPPGPPPEGAAAQPAPAVRLRGPAGGTARGTLTVANRHPRRRRVVLTASPVVDDAGDPVGIELQADPSQVTVPAGGEHVVQLAVLLVTELVTPGATYHAALDVTGAEEAQLDVAVEVLA